MEAGAVTAFLKDPLGMVKSLYSWCGFAVSALTIASIFLAQRPTAIAGRTLGWDTKHVALPLDVAGESASQWAVVVACLAVVVLPFLASLKTGWDDITDAQVMVWRRAGPPAVTFWLALLFAAESGPLDRSDVDGLFHHAAGILWGWAGPLVLIALGVSIALHGAWYVTRFGAVGPLSRTAVEIFWRTIGALLTSTILMVIAVFFVAVLPLLTLVLFLFGLGDERDEGTRPPKARTADGT